MSTSGASKSVNKPKGSGESKSSGSKAALARAENYVRNLIAKGAGVFAIERLSKSRQAAGAPGGGPGSLIDTGTPGSLEPERGATRERTEQEEIDNRLLALIGKEFRQTFRNKHLLFLLFFPPIIQLLILGASLDPDLRNMKVALADMDNTRTSRELGAALASTGLFEVNSTGSNYREAQNLLEEGKVSAAVIIPDTFTANLASGKNTQVDATLDGVDAYTARVASAQLKETIGNFEDSASAQKRKSAIKIEPRFLYNGDLKASWYFVPGLIGSIVTLVGTLVSAATILRERDLGTMDQLLMTPAAVWEILVAKVIPLFTLLMADILIGIFLSHLFFQIPLGANFIWFLVASAFYTCISIGAGILLGTLCRSQRQAQLCSFFINIPMIQLSGSVVPFESMPPFMQFLSSLDPLRYYTLLARSVLLKGTGIDVIWPYLLILLAYAIVIMGFSINRFRRQLA